MTKLNWRLIRTGLLALLAANPAAANSAGRMAVESYVQSTDNKTGSQWLWDSGSLTGSSGERLPTDECNPDNTVAVLGGFDIDTGFDCHVINDIRTEGSLGVLDGGDASFIARFIRLGAGFRVESGGILQLDTSSGTVCGPAAIDLPGNGLDDDCDGHVDNTPLVCDSTLDIASSDPLDGAAALDLCQSAPLAGTAWGVLDAEWVLPDGSMPPADFLENENYHLGHGLLDGFGPNVSEQGGSRLLALSSGTARRPGDPGYQSPISFDKGYQGIHPPGFPVETPQCPGVTSGTQHDAAALKLTLRVPDNVNGFAFTHKFYTSEFPQYICSTYNDFMIVLVNPSPPGALSGNVVFDALGNPLSVNNGFLEVCDPFDAPSPFYLCPLGTAELQGTGFEGHGASRWLQTSVPVTPGTEITVTFAAYDSGDGAYDSTALFDNFRWQTDAVGVATGP